MVQKEADEPASDPRDRQCTKRDILAPSSLPAHVLLAYSPEMFRAALLPYHRSRGEYLRRFLGMENDVPETSTVLSVSASVLVHRDDPEWKMINGLLAVNCHRLLKREITEDEDEDMIYPYTEEYVYELMPYCIARSGDEDREDWIPHECWSINGPWSPVSARGTGTSRRGSLIHSVTGKVTKVI